MNRMNINFVSSNHSKSVFENSKFDIKNEKTGQIQGVLKIEKPVEVLFEGVNLDTLLPG